MKFTFQPWESKILKLPVFTLKPQKISQLEFADLEALPRSSLVSVRISRRAVKQARRLKKIGFYLVENYRQYESGTRAIKKSAPRMVEIKIIGPEAITVCRRLAKQSFSYDRFHRDPHIKKSLADLSRASWIENALRGRAIFVLGAFISKKLVGFIDVNKKAKVAVIDLLAVNSRYRKRRIASQLIQAAKRELKKRRIRRIQVGTQAENLPAISCYRKNNFKLIARYNTFHYHKP